VLAPAGRTAFAGGLALALMETAADYGVAEHMGVPTLGVGIFRAWHGLGDFTAALQIAAGLFVFSLLFIVMESTARKGLRAESARAQRRKVRIRLGARDAMLAIFFCALPVVLGFLVPVLHLVARLDVAAAARAGFGLAIAHTALAAAAAAVAAALIAVLLAYAGRRASSGPLNAALRVATLGYALPGAVIAVGALAAAGAFFSTGVAGGGLAILVYAYVARFLAAAYNGAESGLSQIHPFTDDAARNLGAGPLRIFSTVHGPALLPALAAGALVVFIDCARELPATLLLRPFDFETLATRVYRLASDERLADAAPAALLLIALSAFAALLLEAGARTKP
jgi:iron(III) transport system permease protein